MRTQFDKLENLRIYIDDSDTSLTNLHGKARRQQIEPTARHITKLLF